MKGHSGYATTNSYLFIYLVIYLLVIYLRKFICNFSHYILCHPDSTEVQTDINDDNIDIVMLVFGD